MVRQTRLEVLGYLLICVSQIMEQYWRDCVGMDNAHAGSAQRGLDILAEGGSLLKQCIEGDSVPTDRLTTYERRLVGLVRTFGPWDADELLLDCMYTLKKRGL
jgi:hypothetical protein